MPRIAYLSYSSGEYDGRTQRMAETALAAGYEVIVYARWQRGLPLEEQRPGYRVVRIPVIPELVWPWRRASGRRRLAEIMAGRGEGPAGAASTVSTDAEGAGETAPATAATPTPAPATRAAATPTTAPPPRSLTRKIGGRVVRVGRGALRRGRRGADRHPAARQEHPAVEGRDALPGASDRLGDPARGERRARRHLARDVGGFAARTRPAQEDARRAGDL